MNRTQRFGSSATSSGGTGNVAWSNPTNALTSDGGDETGSPSLPNGSTGTAASVVLSAGQTSEYLVITGFNFDTGPDPVPADAVISGFQVRVQGGALNGYTSGTFSDVRIVVDGGTVGENRSASLPIRAANDGYYSTEYKFGNLNAEGWEEDLYGLGTIVAGKVRSSGFGVAIKVSSPGAATIGIDCVQVRVYWYKPLEAVISHLGLTGPAPFLFCGSAIKSAFGAASFPEECECRWSVSGASAAAQTLTDPRPGANVTGASRNYADKFPAFVFNVLLETQGTHTITLEVIDKNGFASSTSVEVVVTDPATRAVRYVNASTGSNSNAGTSSGAAWATLVYAMQNAPDTCKIVLADDQTHIFTGFTYGAAKPCRDVWITRSGSGSNKPTIDFQQPLEGNNVDRFTLQNVTAQTTGTCMAFYANTTRGTNARNVCIADVELSDGADLWAIGDTGMCEGLLLWNITGGPIDHYVLLPGSWNYVACLGVQVELSATNPGEGLFRVQGVTSSDFTRTGGYGFTAGWCKGIGTGSTQSTLRDGSAYSTVFQCCTGSNSQGNINSFDAARWNIWGAHTQRIDGWLTTNGFQYRKAGTLVCNSILTDDSSDSCTFMAEVEQVRIANTTIMEQGEGADGVLRVVNVGRGLTNQLALENVLIVCDVASPAASTRLYREQKDSGTLANSTNRYLKYAKNCAWQNYSGDRVSLFDAGAFQDYTLAEFFALSGNSGNFTHTATTATITEANDYAVPSSGSLRTGGMVAKGVFRDYRGSGRDLGASNWYVGATGGDTISTPPPSPEDLPSSAPTATTMSSLVASSGQLVATCAIVADATAYSFDISTSSGFASFTTTPRSPANTYTFTGLTNGTTYYVRATTYNDADFSAAASASLNATPQPAVPGATTVSASSGDTTVTLIWQAVAGASGYKLRRGTSPSPSTVIATPSATNYTDTGRTNGTRYYYTVTPTNASGDGPTSNEVSAVPQATGTPPSPPASPRRGRGRGRGWWLGR